MHARTHARTHPHTVSYLLGPQTYGRWLAVSDCHIKFTLLWSVKPRFCFIQLHPEPGWSQEAEDAIQSLDKQLRSEPRFQRALRDTVHPTGSTAQLTCIVNGRVEEVWKIASAHSEICRKIRKMVIFKFKLGAVLRWWHQPGKSLC